MNAHSTHNLLNRDAAPSALAVVSALKADLGRATGAIAEKYCDQGGWPDSNAKAASARMQVAAARDILADHLDRSALDVIDAVIACDAVMSATVYGVKHDYETPTARLTEAAETFADEVCSTCDDHAGVA